MLSNKHAYATTAHVRRAIKAAETAGMHVGGVKLYPDGRIELTRAEMNDQGAANDFDRLDAQGLL